MMWINLAQERNQLLSRVHSYVNLWILWKNFKFLFNLTNIIFEEDISLSAEGFKFCRMFAINI
jgi:hypothetical protein